MRRGADGATSSMTPARRAAQGSARRDRPEQQAVRNARRRLRGARSAARGRAVAPAAAELPARDAQRHGICI